MLDIPIILPFTLSHMNNPITVTIRDEATIRAVSGNPHFKSAELYKAEADGHLFRVDEKCILHGLTSFPEYNGEEVTISAIREDGPFGKCYYVKGRIEEMCNWVYEYRLKSATE